MASVFLLVCAGVYGGRGLSSVSGNFYSGHDNILCGNYIQCENEHVACHWCYNSSSGKCSACTPSTAYKRCQLLEKIIKSLERSWKYLNYGCGQTFSRIMEVDCHEIGCEFAPYSCPIEGCNFSAPSTQLSKHLSDRHGDSITRFRNMVSVNRIGPYTPIIPFSVELEIEDNERVHWDQLSVRYTSKIDSIRSRDAFHRRLSSCPKRAFCRARGIRVNVSNISHWCLIKQISVMDFVLLSRYLDVPQYVKTIG
ncbi:hypothetical protein TIFTF001_031577 [Ficus carica]|uniref:SIAH-type domain-containing protein n=1 Tax=Ficus carica TaxID=3494 RepID=A0AA88DWT3_FICCA|nr:hypothetical protein TIFTF001_031577 [Ficus carica]